jgi:predicted DNA-binding protein (UPF0251 family)
MSRQKCCRKVGCMPVITIYRPDGNTIHERDVVVLSLDEFEAIRLADFSSLYQEDAAKKMDISRQTFGRIIESAHKKIADVLINGKALKIEGGNVSFEYPSRFGCNKCKKSIDCPHRFKEDNCPRGSNEMSNIL